MQPWWPRSLQSLPELNRKTLFSDVIAGITVGLVALPLGMAFAIASGLPPQSGLYCAIVTGFLISALGGSKTQVGGPTGAFVVVVFGIVAQHGVSGLFLCTMMAGVLLVLLGVTGMGSAVKYFPHPVILGFTNGIAVLIASTQVKISSASRSSASPASFWRAWPGSGGTSVRSPGRRRRWLRPRWSSSCWPTASSSRFRDPSWRWCWAR